MQNSNKIWIVDGRWQEFGKCSPDHLKVSELEFFDGILLSKIENVWA